MTNTIQKSLEDNKQQILENLPKEFHADFEASIADAKPLPILTEAQARKAAVELIKENPSIEATSDEECQAYIDNAECFLPEQQVATEAELEQQKEQSLAKLQADNKE